MTTRECSRLHTFFLCCISFVLGYSLATLRTTGSPSAYLYADYPLAYLSNVASLDEERESSNRKNTTDVLVNFVTEWIDQTTGREVFLLDDLSETELKQLFLGALTKALTIEEFGCDKSAKVMRRDLLPSTTDEESPANNEEAASTDCEQPAAKQRRLFDKAKYIQGVGLVDRIDFSRYIDTGVPLYLGNPNHPPVLMMYDWYSLPNNTDYARSAWNAGNDVMIPADEALGNCRQLSIIHVKAGRNDGVCWAFLPGQESFHIQKWLRVKDFEPPKNRGRTPKSNMQQPLRLIARGYDGGFGMEYPGTPGEVEAIQHRKWLGRYFSKIDTLLNKLKPLVERIATNNQLITTVINSGQSELLLNFACATKSRGFNISNVLAFVLDEESKELVEGLGMTAFYDKEFLGELPSNDPRIFGDITFTHIVVAKFIATHLLSVLKYDFLYQDVDLVWYKDPLEFFNDPRKADPRFDMFFQDDMNPGIRYQPFRGNSGFYYVRNNARTRALLKDAVMKYDQLYVSRSHQQTLLEVISEHVSLHGLRVKTFDGYDTNFFPTGGHFQRVQSFMRDFVAGKLKDVYLFHMNWTNKKSEKLAYMKQMGMWFVNDSCTGRPLNETLLASVGTGVEKACCSAQALFSCHFRDKPSIQECRSSPAMNGNASSWWR